MKTLKQKFVEAANVSPDKNAVIYFPIECDYGSMPNNIMVSLKGNLGELYFEKEVEESESNNIMGFPNVMTYIRIYNDDNEFFCVINEDWDTEQTKFIVIDSKWYAENYGEWIKTFISEAQKLGIYIGMDDTFKVQSFKEEGLEVLNGALAHVIFGKENVAIGINNHKWAVLEGASEEDCKGVVAYLIKSSEYEGKTIPEGNGEEDKDGLNDFQRWLANQLRKHSNRMYRSFLKEGVDLKDYDK